MTDEQIKQNAEEYASTKEMHSPRGQDVELDKIMIIEDYIAGAHSRDEEIKQLEFDKYLHTKRIKTQEEIIAELRNQWISVEERLPQESEKYKGWLSDTVFVITNKNDGTSARYDHATKTWCPAKILQGNITHWMPIHKV